VIDAEYRHPIPKNNITGIILSGEIVSKNKNTQNNPLKAAIEARSVSASG